MRTLIGALLLAPALTLLPLPTQPAAQAQYSDDPLPGYYFNVNNGGSCAIYRRPDGYLFVNENGAQAIYTRTGVRQLSILNTLYWDARTVATVGRDRIGRVTIRFDAPGTAPGLWVAAQ